MRRFNLSKWALDNQPMVRFLLVSLLIGGMISFFKLGQDEDPPFTFRAMVVRAYWPGATAEQMAEQVASKLERKLQEVPYAQKIRSYSKPGETQIILQLRDSSPKGDVAGVWYTTRKKINDIRDTLPPGIIGPYFNDEFGDTFGVIYALQGDGFGYAEQKDYAEKLRQELLRVPNVAKVELLGLQDEKIFIEISQRKLAQLGISVPQIADQLNAQNTVEGAGALQRDGDTVWVRVAGEFSSEQQIADSPIRIGQATLRLGDFATVKRAYADPPRDMMRIGEKGWASGKPAIGLGVAMAKGGDIIELGKDLEAAQQKIQNALPVGLMFTKVADQPKAVTASVSEFIRVLIEAVVIVLVVSFIALGLHTKPLRIDVRPGLVVLLTIPLVLAITFLCMYLWDVALHKISLGALIIALGLLVDDAIIAVEMMVRKLEEGFDRVAAATFAYESTAMPMLTGTLITAVGFLPIGMAKSSAGEYTFTIFAVTALALIISWVVAVVFVPYLGYLLLKVKPGAGHEDVFDTPFYRGFRRLVGWCVNRRWVVIALTMGVFAVSIVGFKHIEQQFFPDSSRPELVVDLWLPEGSSIGATDIQAKRFERWLGEQNEVASYISYIGVGSPRFYLPLDQQFNQTNLAQFVITPHSLKERNALRTKVLDVLNTEFPSVRGRAKFLPNGPPVPYPVQFRVTGPDPQQLRQIADKVKGKVAAHPNAVGVNDNWNEQVKILRFDMDQDRARALGVSTQTVMRSVQTILSGAPIGKYRENDRLIDIVVRQPVDERDALDKLNDASIPTASGKSVPLSQLVSARLVWEPGVMWRENRDYAITVQSEVTDGVQGPTVSMAVDKTLDELRAQLPFGYQIAAAGAQEESRGAQQSIVVNLPIMLFIVLTLLMLQLNSFARTLLVYLTGPLGLIGAAAALLAFNAPFGFVAQLGVIALLGMIIRNSVILIDQIEQDIADGADRWEAVVGAAVRRLRPIVLTAAAAVLAMIPLTRSVFWGPMAIAIMGGLIVATVLTLLFLPAVYAAAFKVPRKALAA